MYRLEVYETTGTSITQVVLFQGEVNVHGWNHRINAPGRMVFSMNRFHILATDENLLPYRRVRLYRKTRDTGVYEAVWFGYIEGDRDECREVKA